MALLAVAIFLLLLLALFTVINCPWGLGAATFFVLATAVVFFALGLAAAVLLAGAQVWPRECL